MSVIPPEIERSWEEVGPLLCVRTEQEYDEAVKRLNALLDQVGTDEGHSLYSLLDTLGTVLQAYEEEHHAMPDCSGTELLRGLMEEHGLTQSELPEVGSQGVVSDVLRGVRDLNVRQIRALSARFGVSPAVFF